MGRDSGDGDSKDSSEDGALHDCRGIGGRMFVFLLRRIEGMGIGRKKEKERKVGGILSEGTGSLLFTNLG